MPSYSVILDYFHNKTIVDDMALEFNKNMDNEENFYEEYT